MPCDLYPLRRLAIALVIGVGIAGIAAPAALRVWNAIAPTVPVRAGPAGRLVAATVHHAFLPGNTVTTIRTSTGTVIVHGAFSGPRGTPLTVVRTNKTPRAQLCGARSLTQCAWLAGTWAGSFPVTGRADTAFNFQRYGLTTSNLDTWGTFGATGWALTVLFALVVFCAGDDGKAGPGNDRRESAPTPPHA